MLVNTQWIVCEISLVARGQVSRQAGETVEVVVPPDLSPGEPFQVGEAGEGWNMLKRHQNKDNRAGILRSPTFYDILCKHWHDMSIVKLALCSSPLDSAWLHLRKTMNNILDHIGSASHWLLIFQPSSTFFNLFNFLAQVNYLGVRYDLQVPENLQAGDTFHVSVSLPPKLATWHVKKVKNTPNTLDISCAEAKAKDWAEIGGNDG